MIKTSRQLKEKIKNLTHGDSLKSQTLLRTYMMERFLERLAVSQYNSHFVLKGGMLVSSMVGIHQRATMDIDATVVALPLTLEDATRTIQEIVNIDLQDGVVFSITNAESIMEEHDYPGLRFTLIGTLDGLRQKVKIDISTGDAITPRAIEYRYPLMFEDRSLQIMSYNLETLLAEKLETIMYRGTSNVSVGAQALIIVRISTLLNPLDWRIIKFTIRGGDFCVCAVFFALVTDLWKLSEPCGIVSLQEKVRNPGN